MFGLLPYAPALQIGLQMAGLLAVAGLLASVLVGLAVAAFIRRRSRPYLLVALALAALLGRSVVLGLSATDLLSPVLHHYLEHALDIVMAALVIAAVLSVRAVIPASIMNGEDHR
jgi:branched-subunit amino acid transport protein